MQEKGHLVFDVQYFILLWNEEKKFYKLVGVFGESIKNDILHSYMTYSKCMRKHQPVLYSIASVLDFVATLPAESYLFGNTKQYWFLLF